jgi:hypothetical protein
VHRIKVWHVDLLEVHGFLSDDGSGAACKDNGLVCQDALAVVAHHKRHV